METVAKQRDLRFFPIPDRPTKRLSRAQVDQFNRDGYLKGFRIFDRPQADANRASFDHLLEMTRARGEDSYSINGYHRTCQCIYDIVVNPHILDLVEDILGPNFIAWGSHYFCKMPGEDRAVSWHQDAPYWPLSPSKTVTAWVAIDDADEENSAMLVIPGSHRDGPVAHRDSAAEEKNVLWLTADLGRFNGVEPVSMNLRAGEISLHSDLLVHGSKPNRSQRRRCGLTIRYATVDVRSDWGRDAIYCRGRDASGYWGRIERPSGNELPEQNNAPPAN